MLIQIQLKDPDGVYDSISEYVKASTLRETLSDDEIDAIAEMRRKDANEALKPWIRYSEYLTVEINTDTGETKVLKQ